MITALFLLGLVGLLVLAPLEIRFAEKNFPAQTAPVRRVRRHHHRRTGAHHLRRNRR